VSYAGVRPCIRLYRLVAQLTQLCRYCLFHYTQWPLGCWAHYRYTGCRADASIRQRYVPLCYILAVKLGVSVEFLLTLIHSRADSRVVLVGG